jgi:AraC-like DNA-binding protein
MRYTQFSPAPRLMPYIDCYWHVRGQGAMAQQERILPDGCVDIIISIGENFHTDSMVMTYENVYIVGTMTHCKLPFMDGGIQLFGIRFKPGAFAAFYQYASLREFTDRTIDFEKKLSPSPVKIKKYGIAYLDQFYLDRFAAPKHSLFPVLEDMQQYHGTLPVEMIAKKHFITGRQLERKFNQFVGVNPREFSSFVRYQFAAKKIKNNLSKKTLHEIARQCGYYDHSHLVQAIKKYSGLLPSQL